MLVIGLLDTSDPSGPKDVPTESGSLFGVISIVSEKPQFSGLSGEVDFSGVTGSGKGFVSLSCCIFDSVSSVLLASLLFLFSSDYLLLFVLLLAWLCVAASLLIFCS